jgi:hypothetical protein
MLTNKKTLLALSIVSALTLTACGSDNDDNVVVEPPVTPPVVTPPPVIVVPEAPAELSFVATVTVVSAKDGSLVETPITISLLEGDTPTNKVTDIDGNAITSVTTDGGIATFTLKAGEKPVLRAVINAEGFVPANQVLDLTNLDADFASSIVITPAVQGEGVAVKQETATVSGGQVATETTVKAAEAEATAEVKVPAGTTMQDAAGNPVSGTSVTMKVQTAGSTASETTAAVADMIPAGLNDVTTNATAVRQPLSVANIEMVDNTGKQIKKFNPAIDVTIAVPESAGVKTGDTLNVSSYDEATAKWTRDEFVATVGAFDPVAKTYAASFKTDHLTLFTSTKNTEKCTAPNILDFGASGISDADLANGNVTISLFGKGKDGGAAIRSAGLSTFISKAKGVGIAADAQGTVIVSYKGVKVFEGADLPICNFQVPNVSGAIAEQNPLNTTANFSFQCSNTGAAAAVPLTGASVTAVRGGKPTVLKGNGTGAYSGQLVATGTYNIKVNLPEAYKGAQPQNGQAVLNNLTQAQVGALNVVFTKECQVTTGS